MLSVTLASLFSSGSVGVVPIPELASLLCSAVSSGGNLVNIFGVSLFSSFGSRMVICATSSSNSVSSIRVSVSVVSLPDVSDDQEKKCISQQ